MDLPNGKIHVQVVRPFRRNEDRSRRKKVVNLGKIDQNVAIQHFSTYHLQVRGGESFMVGGFKIDLRRKRLDISPMAGNSLHLCRSAYANGGKIDNRS